MGQVRSRLIFDTSGFRKGTKSVNRSMRTMKTRSASTFKSMAGPIAGITAGLIGMAAAAKAFRFGVTTIAEFGAEMSQVEGITQATASEMQTAEKVVRKLASITKFTAGETASALAELARGGLSMKDALSTLPAVLDGAAAGNMEVKDTANGLIGVFNVMSKQGYNATRAMDIITKAANTSATSQYELMESFRYTLSAGGLLEAKMEELAAATGVLADNGLRADMAGAGLRNVFLQLNNPGSTAAKKMRELGMAADQINPKVVGLRQAIKNIYETPGSEDMLSSMFGTRTFAAFATLFQNLDSYDAKLKTLQGSAGEAQRMQEAMMNNLKGDWLKLKSMVSETFLSTGVQDFLRSLVSGVTEAVAKVANAFKVLNQVIAAGDMGALLKNTLILGFKESINFFLRLMQAALNSIGPAIVGIINMAIARFKLLTDPDFWKGMGHALLGVAAQFASVMHDIMAGIFDAAAKIPGLGWLEDAAQSQRDDSNLLKEGAADSYERAAKAFSDPMAEYTRAMVRETQKIGEAFGTNFKNARDFLDSSKEKEALAEILGKAQEEVNKSLAEVPGREEGVGPGAREAAKAAAVAVEKSPSPVGAIAGAINTIFGRSVNANILTVNKQQLDTQKKLVDSQNTTNATLERIEAAGLGGAEFA